MAFFDLFGPATPKEYTSSVCHQSKTQPRSNPAARRIAHAFAELLNFGMDPCILAESRP
jgi:hypothetical protein